MTFLTSNIVNDFFPLDETLYSFTSACCKYSISMFQAYRVQ